MTKKQNRDTVSGEQPSAGDTRVAQNETAHVSKPRLPHEHDESADSQIDKAPVDDTRGRMAHNDVERGVVDTDKGPVIDQAYDRVKNTP